jgi:hypothetical protein
MLDTFGVRKENWRDALDPAAVENHPAAPADFALSESPRFVERAVVALASDPDRSRWNQASLTSGQLARVYGFTDLDGTQPDIWRYLEEGHQPGAQLAVASAGADQNFPDEHPVLTVSTPARASTPPTVNPCRRARLTRRQGR